MVQYLQSACFEQCLLPPGSLVVSNWHAEAGRLKKQSARQETWPATVEPGVDGFLE